MKTIKSCKYNGKPVKGLSKADSDSVSYEHQFDREGVH